MVAINQYSIILRGQSFWERTLWGHCWQVRTIYKRALNTWSNIKVVSSYCKSWLYVFQIRPKNIFFLITYHRNFSFHRCLFFSKLCCIYRNKNIERIHLPSSLPNTFHIVLGSYGTGLSHICRNDDLLIFRGCPDASRWSSIYL